MKVFKFGGASIQDAQRIRNVKSILETYPHDKLVVIISAMGKTTNALEKVAEAFFNNESEKALQLYQHIKLAHLDLLSELVTAGSPAHTSTLDLLGDLFTEVEWLLHDKAVREYDYYYDQIVCNGELMSTAIISGYLNASGIANKWLDARDIVATDDDFREAHVDMATTKLNMHNKVLSALSQANVVITQGFIGSTSQNESTTLGREGSDYSAALFANMLDAESQTIWKDVEGVMNADPKKYAQAVFLEKLSYAEIIEMAYHGAQVIHPKTIKPLQNKNIPLHVRCFLQPQLPGTIINGEEAEGLPPIIMSKEDQMLVSMRTKDFSLMGEPGICELYKLLATHMVKPVLTQHEALEIHYCFSGRTDKIRRFAAEAAAIFDVEITTGLTMLTVRHYDNDILQSLVKDKKVIFKQRSTDTAQFLLQ